MTQQQATRFLADKAMGWGFNAVKDDAGGCRFCFRLAEDGVPIWSAIWDPFHDANHALEVLEAMLATGWHAVMLCPANGRHYCDFYRGPMTNRDDAPYGHESLSAAICLAAVFALGGEVGDA